jgi:hypothetical protein
LEIEFLLSKCWDQFDGADVSGMIGSKLNDRTENMNWQPPILSFDIERHGRTVGGSIYADFHTWTLDFQQKAATVNEWSGKRQIYPRASGVKMGPIVEEIADLIREGKQDKRLRWKGANQVTVNLRATFPAGVKATFDGRKKRFQEGLSAALGSAGWRGGFRGIWRKENSENNMKS